MPGVEFFVGLLGYVVGAAFAMVVLFWVLFFFIVLPRLADAKAMPPVDRKDFSFLYTKVPHAELAAYAALLSADERRRWYNRVLVQPILAGWVLALIAVIFVVGLLSVR